MKYIASINFDNETSSQSFDTIKEAKAWLDSQNNNLEYTTKIAEVNDKWQVMDWFYYTEAN